MAEMLFDGMNPESIESHAQDADGGPKINSTNSIWKKGRRNERRYSCQLYFC